MSAPAVITSVTDSRPTPLPWVRDPQASMNIIIRVTGEATTAWFRVWEYFPNIEIKHFSAPPIGLVKILPE